VAALCNEGLVAKVPDALHLGGIVVTFVGQNLGPFLQLQHFVGVFDELTKGLEIVFVGGLCTTDELICIVYHRLDVVADERFPPVLDQGAGVRISEADLRVVTFRQMLLVAGVLSLACF